MSGEEGEQRLTPDDLTDEQLERAFQLTIQTIRDNKLYRSEG